MWKRFSLTTSLQGNKMNVLDAEEIKVGDVAKTLSALRPMGTVMFINKRYEAQSNGEHISENADVTIMQILPNKVIVKTV